MPRFTLVVTYSNLRVAVDLPGETILGPGWSRQACKRRCLVLSGGVSCQESGIGALRQIIQRPGRRETSESPMSRSVRKRRVQGESSARSPLDIGARSRLTRSSRRDRLMKGETNFNRLKLTLLSIWTEPNHFIPRGPVTVRPPLPASTRGPAVPSNSKRSSEGPENSLPSLSMCTHSPSTVRDLSVGRPRSALVGTGPVSARLGP